MTVTTKGDSSLPDLQVLSSQEHSVTCPRKFTDMSLTTGPLMGSQFIFSKRQSPGIMQYVHIWGWVPIEPWGSSSREMAKLTIEDSTRLLGHCLISNPSWVLVFSFCKTGPRYTERVMAFVRGRCGCGTDPQGHKECRGLGKCLKTNSQTGVHVEGATDC